MDRVSCWFGWFDESPFTRLIVVALIPVVLLETYLTGLIRPPAHILGEVALYAGSVLGWALLGRFAAWLGHRIAVPKPGLASVGPEGPIAWAIACVLCLAAPAWGTLLGLAVLSGWSLALGVVVAVGLALFVRRVVPASSADARAAAPAALRALRRWRHTHPPGVRFPWDDPSRWR